MLLTCSVPQAAVDMLWLAMSIQAIWPSCVYLLAPCSAWRSAQRLLAAILHLHPHNQAVLSLNLHQLAS